MTAAASGAKQFLLAELARTPFQPAWWARSGLAQTVAGVLGASSAPSPLRLEVWDTPDGDRLRLHFLDAGAPLPVVLLLHGLEGSRDSVYAREVARLCALRGWQLVILEFRSCGGEINRARRTYHSGETTDLGFVVDRLQERLPGRPLFALGFSLGGNVLLKWLGEQGERLPAALVAAAAVSPPFDLEQAARQCDRRYGGAMTRHFLRTLIPKALAKEAQYPGCLDAAAVRRCRTFASFDDIVTAPLHGFRDAMHYWQSSSCGPFVARIRRPTLLIAAVDDPLSPSAALPRTAAAASPFLVPQFEPHGGHVGFVAGGWPWRPRRWAEAQALRFFAAVPTALRSVAGSATHTP